MQVLDTGLIQRHGIQNVGLLDIQKAVLITRSEIAEALAAKNALAKRDGLNMYISLILFRGRYRDGWERDVRAAGNAAIRIGIPGPATIKTLFRCPDFWHWPVYAVYFKTGPQCCQIDDGRSPHLLLANLAAGMAADPDCLIKHFHFYPFGGFAKTAAYASAVANGDIKILPKGGSMLKTR